MSTTEKPKKQAKPTTKIVSVTTTLFKCFEHTEFIEVPASMSKADMQALVKQRSEEGDPSGYVENVENTKRGPASSKVVDEATSTPTLMAWMTPRGIHVEAYKSQEPDVAKIIVLRKNKALHEQDPDGGHFSDEEAQQLAALEANQA